VVNPEDIVKPRDKVSVLIKDLDLSKRRITLSLREAKGDPWRGFMDQYAAGQSISGTLEKKEKFGFFIKLVPGVVGLLPMSKINQSAKRADLEKLQPGEPVTVVVEEIRAAERKVSLSPGDAADETDWKRHAKSDSASLGTLGDKLRRALRIKQKKDA
jgi:small subunit ribosomal protein S1